MGLIKRIKEAILRAFGLWQERTVTLEGEGRIVKVYLTEGSTDQLAAYILRDGIARGTMKPYKSVQQYLEGVGEPEDHSGMLSAYDEIGIIPSEALRKLASTWTARHCVCGDELITRFLGDVEGGRTTFSTK